MHRRGVRASAAGEPVDRERIFADAGLKREFRAWLLDRKPRRAGSRHILVPEKFLATGAIAATPVGFASSIASRHLAWSRPTAIGNEVFGEGEVVAALKKPRRRGIAFENIRSVAGFERRLNDITCAGCHQTRASALSFSRVRLDAEKPSNSRSCRRRRTSSATKIRRRDIPHRATRRRGAGLFARIFRPGAIARQHRARGHRI